MNEINIYAPPKSNLIQNDNVLTEDSLILINELKSESTWKFFFFTTITIGIYSAHYIKRQSAIINKHIDVEQRISEGLIYTFLILSYVSALLLIHDIFFELVYSLNILSNVIDLIWIILLWVWAFMAGSRMNILLSSIKGKEYWFHSFWIIMFQQYYFNYKINKINERMTYENMLGQV